MPEFLIEQYETHDQTYEVEAANMADAVEDVLNGNVEASENGPEYIEVNDEMGMSGSRQPELAAELKRRGTIASADLIESIRYVEEVTERHAQSD